jgi:hypothetical protein
MKNESKYSGVYPLHIYIEGEFLRMQSGAIRLRKGGELLFFR